MPKRSRRGGRDPERGRGGPEGASPCKQSRPASPLSFQSPQSLFDSLVQPVGTERFFQDFWEQRPLLLQGRGPALASYYRSLFQLADLQALCSRGLRFYRDLNLVRCVNGKKEVLNREGLVKKAALASSLRDHKASVQFHQPQRFQDELWRILEKLESFFGALVGSNIYVTPEESQGLPPHCDDVEVFILQLEGEKRWRLYEPSVPLAAKYRVEPQRNLGSPTHDFILKTGDLLYFPRGTVHQAETPAGVRLSTHLTLSTYQRMSWGDVLVDSVPSLVSERSRTDVVLRGGVPRRLFLDNGRDPETNRRLAAILRTLAQDLESGQEVTSSHMKKDFITNRLPPAGLQPLPAGPVPSLEDKVCLRWKDHLVVALCSDQQNLEEEEEEEEEQQSVFVFHSLKNCRDNHMMGDTSEDEEELDVSKGLRFPRSHLPALQQLQQEDQVLVQNLHLPSDQDKLSLSLSLWTEGLLTVL